MAEVDGICPADPRTRTVQPRAAEPFASDAPCSRALFDNELQIESPHLGGDGPILAPRLRSLLRSPHPCGDGPAFAVRWLNIFTSPPPAWGWTPSTAGEVPLATVSPTRVGMDPCDSRVKWSPIGLPHPRGDGPGISAPGTGMTPSPPPAWGWTRQISTIGDHFTVSPTRVGMDPRSASTR